MLDPNLTLCTEDAVKFQFKLSDYRKTKMRQKQSRNRV